MAASLGLEHVEAALKLIEEATDVLGSLSGLDETWRGDAVAKLGTMADLLRVTAERFFLKTRACLPFARRSQEEAEKLLALAREMAASLAPDAQARLNAALAGLTKAVKTLDERSQMLGLAIT